MFPNTRGWTGARPPSSSFQLNKQSSQVRGLYAWFPLSAWAGSLAGHNYAGGDKFKWIWTTDAWVEFSVAPGEVGRALHTWSTGSPSSPLVANWGTMPAMQSASQLTISFWYKHITNKGLLVGQQSGAGEDSICLEVWITNNLEFGIGDGSFQSGRVAYPSLEWNLVTGVFNGSLTGNAERVKIYINGKPQTLDFQGYTIPATTVADASNHALHVHGASGDGYVQDIRYYDYALTEKEVFNIYNPSTRWELYEPTKPKYWAITYEITPDGKIHKVLKPHRDIQIPVRQLNL